MRPKAVKLFLKALITATCSAAAFTFAQAADTDSAIIRYNGPIYMNNDARVPPISIPAGYIGLVRCLNDDTCRLVSQEPMKAPVPCDKSPFGDPPSVLLDDGQENLAKALRNHQPIMTMTRARAKVRMVFSRTCEAKYGGTGRADFYHAGITDHDFDTRMVFTLASTYIAVEIAHGRVRGK